MRFAAIIITCLSVAYVHAYAEEDVAVVRKMSENKFTSVPEFPSCLTQAVQNGDPSKGPAVILFKAKAGCLIPWHWHTPMEQIMMVSGSAKVQMKDSGKSTVLRAGGYAKLPSKHVHQFTCTSNCTGFVISNAAFDIHYVDASGKEIPAEAALAGKQ